MRMQAMVGRDCPALGTCETRVADGSAIRYYRLL